jgi:hypothetical protein
VKTIPPQVRHTPVIEYRLPRCQSTTALLNGHPVAVDQDHRRWSAADYIPGAPETPGHYEPVVLTVSAPISLSLEDVVALLFDWGGLSYEDLADDHLVRALVAETVVNHGCSHLEELRCRLGERTSLTQDATTWLAYCRHRATSVFTPHPAPSVEAR